MKPQIIISLIVLSFFSFKNPCFAQVGIGTTNPHASAMLDIVSSDKGVLIPRMNSGTRTGISSPAPGLLVFDTVTNSFWYYNSGWVELVSEKTLIDTDGDTKIQVQRSTGPDDDEINFTTTNIDRMKISNDTIVMGTDLSAQATTFFEIDTDGTIKLGNKGPSTTPDSDNDGGEENYTKITADGSLSYVGNATRWDDLKVAVNSVKIGGGKKDAVDFTPAEWDAFKELGLALLWFEDEVATNEQDIVFTVQMPHAWKEGTNIFPHVHWSAGRIDSKTGLPLRSPVPNTSRVTWGLEYSWVTVGGVFPDATIITGTDIAKYDSAHNIALYEHVITPLGSSGGIDGSGKTLSSMLVCRLFRNSSAGTDNYAGDAGLLEIDFHFQIDSDGSNQEYTKE